jgi:hypothetical protein
VPNKVLYESEASATLIGGVTATPTLKNLASAARALGDEVNNEDANQFADIELKARFTSAPAAGAVVELYLVNAIDGTNYEDGDSSTTPARPPDAILPVRAVTTQQRVTVRSVVLPAGKFKPLIVNTAGVAMTNTDSENILTYRPFNDEVQ